MDHGDRAVGFIDRETVGGAMKKILLSFLFTVLAFSASAQNVTRNITDPGVRMLIVRALEEADKLTGVHAPGRFDAALFLVDVAENTGGELTGFRVVDVRGTDMLPRRKSFDEIQYLLGDHVASLLRDGVYDYERIEPGRIAREFVLRAYRENRWWGTSSIELAVDRIALRLPSSSIGFIVSTGDILYGLPTQLTGAMRIGVATRTVQAGLLVPVSQAVLASPGHKLDGGIGGFAGFSISEGIIGAGGDVYIQRIHDPSYVNYTDKAFTVRSPFGARMHVDVALPLSDQGPVIDLMAGYQSIAIERGKVSENDIVQVTTDPSGKAVESYETASSPMVVAGFATGLIRSASGLTLYRMVELRAGYAQRAVIASVTINPFSWLGVKADVAYRSSPRDWEPDLGWSITPVLRF
jgi:hypothetical protein